MRFMLSIRRSKRLLSHLWRSFLGSISAKLTAWRVTSNVFSVSIGRQLDMFHRSLKDLCCREFWVFLESKSKVPCMQLPDVSSFPLLDACVKGDLSRVQSLVTMGLVAISDTTRDGWTALHLASVSDNPNLVEYISKLGVSLTSKLP